MTALRLAPTPQPLPLEFGKVRQQIRASKKMLPILLDDFVPGTIPFEARRVLPVGVSPPLGWEERSARVISADVDIVGVALRVEVRASRDVHYCGHAASLPLGSPQPLGCTFQNGAVVPYPQPDSAQVRRWIPGS